MTDCQITGVKMERSDWEKKRDEKLKDYIIPNQNDYDSEDVRCMAKHIADWARAETLKEVEPTNDERPREGKEERWVAFRDTGFFVSDHGRVRTAWKKITTFGAKSQAAYDKYCDKVHLNFPQRYTTRIRKRLSLSAKP